jgi:hypothetical protein
VHELALTPSATVSALASQENDSNPNSLILITIGDAQPLPVPSSSTLPHNILHLDVLALEYRLLRRAQEQGIPGTPERQHPLPSLAALLQTLQIPVPHYAPLGNAGNDAFFTLLAFQKLMMAETRLPDLLFRGPAMTIPPFMPPAPTYARPLSSQRVNSYESESPRHSRRMSTGEAIMAPPERQAVPTTRQPNVRAQTVFWDDSQYSPDIAKTREPSSDGERGRTKPKLPSSMSSRSVSWVDNLPLDPPAIKAVRSNTSSPYRPPANLHSASSTKLSLDSGSSAEGAKQKPKLKSNPSVKNLAGSLARFWVG